MAKDKLKRFLDGAIAKLRELQAAAGWTRQVDKARDARAQKKKKREEARALAESESEAQREQGGFVAAFRRGGLLEALFYLGAESVDAADEILDELGEIVRAGGELALDVGAWIISFYDLAAEVVVWLVHKTFILVARRIYAVRIRLQQYQKELSKIFMGTIIAATAIIAFLSSITVYEYSYNGRTLGVVRDQKDVLEIMDLVSEELTREYGSDVQINPDTDISFRPVLAQNREIDDADAVLRRFTYMGTMQTQAYALYAGEQLLAVLESEQAAQDVLDMLLAAYLDGSDVEYESAGFAEDTFIEACDTTLAEVVSREAAFESILHGGQAEVTYEVELGDTLYGIIEKLDVTMDELMDMNPQLNKDPNKNVLHVGDTFVISREVPLVTVETVEVATFAEPVDYETEYRDSSSYYEGEEVVIQSGKNGRARIKARITRDNGREVAREILSRKVIQEPVTKIVVRGTKPVPPKKGTGTFIRPVNVAIYSGYGWRWGRMHYGIDLPASIGTPIRASDGGTVTLAGWYYGYGLTVIIDHGGGYKTLYGHCNSISVSVGQQVYQGQTIAGVGVTGNVTGAHCHFEIFKNGVNVNPANYV